VQLFAAARERVGCETVDLQYRSGITVADLKSELLKSHPGLEPLRNSLLWAVNSEYAAADRVLCENDAVACFPPVSGG
jgi:molybdopterin converting factor small subunit